MLEQQIYSIESANINQETLAAMKNAGKAIKEIHGNMKIEDVDTTMYVLPNPPNQPDTTAIPHPFLVLQDNQLTLFGVRVTGSNSANSTN